MLGGEGGFEPLFSLAVKKKRVLFHARALDPHSTNCPKQTAHAAFEKRSLMLSRERCTKKMLVNDRKSL